MSFNLTIVFTGLVGFVENCSTDSRARMCALLVNGDPKPDQPFARKSSLDGSDLRRHRAFVTYPALAVSGASEADGSAIWYLKGERLFIETADAQGPDAQGNPRDARRNDFKINQLTLPASGKHPVKPADTPRSDWSSFTWAMDMQQACCRFKVDPQLLSAQPPPGRVAAQVFLDRGTLATKSLTRAIWGFRPALWQPPYEQVFSHEIILIYQDLDAARLLAFDPGSKWPKVLDLTSLQRNGAVVIEIVNTCDDNPLQWLKSDDPKADSDTKWIFELADPDAAGWIRSELAAAGQLLPIPVPLQILADGIGTPRSGNCIPPRLPTTCFSCPELDPPATARERVGGH